MKRCAHPCRYFLLSSRPSCRAEGPGTAGASLALIPPAPRPGGPLRTSHPQRQPEETTHMIGEDVMVPCSETESLRQQLLQAQRLSSVGALASSVAHEFNNILTTIINYARLGMRAENDPAARAQAFEKILKGGQRAATIVNSMLGFARNHSTQRMRADLIRLVEEVLLLTEKDLSKHRVQVEKKFHDHPAVTCVPGQIEQILLNLV